MRVVDNAVADGVGDGRIADVVVPFCHRQLTGHDSRFQVVAVIHDFRQVTALVLVHAYQSPVIDDQDIDSGNSCQKSDVGPVGPGQAQLVEELGGTPVERSEAPAACLVGKRTGDSINSRGSNCWAAPKLRSQDSCSIPRA